MKNQRGFTLVEILVTLAIIVIVALMMYGIFGQGLSLYAVESDSAKEQMGLRTILSDITNKVRLSDFDNITYTDSKLTVEDYVYELEDGKMMRNDSILYENVALFDVNIKDRIMEITIINDTGSKITTSLSLIK